MRELRPAGGVLEVFRVFLRLGLTSFGGPVAHLGYFRGEFVARRRWLDEAHYLDIVALCQFLPGPASSQTGITIGILRAGLPGGLAAWIGFSAPSAVAMILFGYGVGRLGDIAQVPWLHGLKIVAVAVVAQALWGMARTLCPDKERATIAIAAAALVLAAPSAAGQIGAIVAGGLLGLWRLPATAVREAAPLAVRIGRPLAIISLILFFVLLFALPPLAAASGSHLAELIGSFYRSGALVFGGGHVVLPLLQQAVVPPGWLGNDAFMAGYGAAQAVPGPLFTFAAYLGTVMRPEPNGWVGGLICVAAIYLPSFLLLIGVLPFWDALRGRRGVRAALTGINAAVVGLLLAALYRPVWTSAIFGPADFALGIAAYLLLVMWRAPPWLVVILGAAGASIIARV
ncbi:MAG TPA: chromate efflux transporter [Stellaceae bacterium]|nr:chromate efflux transporter [Stellaceae bacterium]